MNESASVFFSLFHNFSSGSHQILINLLTRSKKIRPCAKRARLIKQQGVAGHVDTILGLRPRVRNLQGSLASSKPSAATQVRIFEVYGGIER